MEPKLLDATILIIEDTPTQADVLATLLQGAGYRVQVSLRAGQVVERLHHFQQIDLILLDTLLPDMDGFDVCRLLKQHEATWDIPVIFITALNDLHDKLTGFEVGGVDYITKPFANEEVLARIHTQIRFRKLQQQYLRQLERFRVLSQATFEGILIAHQQTIVEANEVALQLFGYKGETLLHQPLTSLFPELAATALPAQGEQDLPQETLGVKQDGTRFPVEIRTKTIPHQNELAQIWAIRDLTWRKQVEQELRATKAKELAIAAEQEQLERENRALKALMTRRERFGELVGKSPAMQRVYDAILKAAATEVNVSISGESGTGKELVARLIHQHSARQHDLFMPVNCSAIPETLFESELFGHCKGAFTGAHKDKPGVFDLVRKGTLFLDEINSLPLAMQVKLLRVLEGEPYRPVGGNTFKRVEARIIVAGNEDFAHLVQTGKMRLDFFYRIHVMAIGLPPLREHKEDLPLLIQDLLEQYRQNGQVPILPNHVLDTFMHHDWPGNVRELQNVLHRYLTTGDVSFAYMSSVRSLEPEQQTPFAELSVNGLGLQHAIAQYERQLIQHTLATNAGHKGHTAAQLQVDPKTLYRKIKHYGLV